MTDLHCTLHLILFSFFEVIFQAIQNHNISAQLKEIMFYFIYLPNFLIGPISITLTVRPYIK